MIIIIYLFNLCNTSQVHFYYFIFYHEWFDNNHCPSLPTCISSSVILRWRPNNCCCNAVFSPFKAVICCWIRLFSAFWKLKCLFLKLWNLYIYSSMRTSSFERLFLTSAVFIVRTDSRVSFSLLSIWTSFLWLLSSFEMFFICCWIILDIPIEFEVFLWEKRDCYWSFGQFSCRNYLRFCLPSNYEYW